MWEIKLTSLNDDFLLNYYFSSSPEDESKDHVQEHKVTFWVFLCVYGLIKIQL